MRQLYESGKVRYLFNTVIQLFDLFSVNIVHLAKFFHEFDSLSLYRLIKLSKRCKNVLARELIRMFDCQFFDLYAKIFLVA